MQTSHPVGHVLFECGHKQHLLTTLTSSLMSCPKAKILHHYRPCPLLSSVTCHARQQGLLLFKDNMEAIQGGCLISLPFATPDCQNMKTPRKNMPSPVHQHVLWSSQLTGMEQSVCSFKSFISIVPPNPRPELYKPLPPTPELTPKTPFFSSTFSEQAPSIDTWSASEEMEWKDSSSSAQRLLSLPLLSSRRYSPPPPPPPSSISRIDQEKTDSKTLPQKTRMPRPPSLKLDQGKPHIEPDPPSRNPARHSRSHTICASTTRGLGTPSAMMNHKRSGSSSVILKPLVYHEVYLSQTPPATAVTFLDMDDSASEASTEVKSLAWSSIGSPRTTKFDWGEVRNVATVMDARAKTQEHQIKHRSECYTSHRRGFVLRDAFQERELARRLEQLSLVEDFRERSADLQHEPDMQFYKQGSFLAPPTDIIKSTRSFYPRRPSKDQQPIPATSGWRNSNSFIFLQHFIEVRKRCQAKL